MDVINRKNGKKNRKSWVYYKDLTFLVPHVDLYRLDDSMKGNDSQNNSDTIPIYLKEDYLEADEKHIFFTEEETTENDDSVTYQIKIAKGQYDEEHISENIDEDNLLEGHYVEERLDDSAIMDLEDQVNKVMQKLETNEHTYMVLEQSSDEAVKESDIEDTGRSYQQQTFKTDHLESHLHPSTSSSETAALPQKNVIDPDERYLLSCLPAFKRLTPQQKGLIRMGIERLFYEVEFQNDDEPRNKKIRNS